jgi:TatD DNase family protein
VLIDSHCHLDLPVFKNKQIDVLKACWALDIERVLVPGLSVNQFEGLLKLKQKVEAYSQASAHDSQNSASLNISQIDICLGCHPYFQKELDSTALEQQKQSLWHLASEHADSISAIGECGLDGSLSRPMKFQEAVLNQHIDLAMHFNRPLILHHRQSHNELIRCLKQAKFDKGGIIHAFSGSQQIAETYIDMGFLLGVGGTITYERAQKTRNTLSNISLDYLVLETDAPDMPLFGFQGEPNSPVQLPLVANYLAQLKQCEVSKVQSKTTENYKNLLDI